MSRLNLRAQVQSGYDRGGIANLFGQVETQVNGLTEGLINAVTNADTAAPTTGDHAQGDIVRNSEPAEAGAGGSKYVVIGWICTVSGTPGTWLPMRVLTGN